MMKDFKISKKLSEILKILEYSRLSILIIAVLKVKISRQETVSSKVLSILSAFNIILEINVIESKVAINETIFHKSIQLPVFADI